MFGPRKIDKRNPTLRTGRRRRTSRETAKGRRTPPLTRDPLARNEEPLPELVTTRGMARLLGCSVRTVRRRISAGDLPSPFKVGATRYWRRRSIEAWLLSRERMKTDS